MEEDPFGRSFLERIFQTPEKTRKARLGKIEKALQLAVPQLRQLNVTKDEEARLVYDPALIGIDRIIQTLAQAGYFSTFKEPADVPPAFQTLSTREPEPLALRLDELVCYCFGYSRKDIETDFFQHHRSLILEKIAAEKKAGGCDCANRNPKGR